MNSIRPLITITILVVVGAFLYVKINQGPVRPVPGTSDPWPSQSPEGVPPLATSAAATPQSAGPAPPWSANPPAVASSPSTSATSVADPSAQQPPAVPPIPEMPEATPPPQPAAPAITSVPLPSELPANIPTARYPDQPAPPTPVAQADLATNVTLPATTPSPPATATQPAMTAEQTAMPITPMTPEQANSMDVAAADVSSPPLAAQQNPLRPSPPAPAEGDRYAAAANPPEPAMGNTPSPAVQASFATSWPTIQAALNQGDLARAHQLLSRWHNDPTLTPTDTELVDTLLSQLAGTIIYSTEHQLEPAYTVKPGDTLETIAKQYDVPWQLLAKINGITAADQVRPGQELKVVRGPFSAVVDLDRKQLTLLVGDRYAGKFPVTLPSAAAVSEGQWTVNEKVVVPSTSVAQSAYTSGQAAVDRAIVLRSEPTTGQAAAVAALTIASGEVAVNSAAGAPAIIRVSQQDAEELSDILSIGSRVVIER
jgi:hypothetical protein